MTDTLAHQALRIAFAAGANNPSHIIDALEAAGLEIVPVRQTPEALPDDPVDYVRDVIMRRGISAYKLAEKCGLAPSTLNRALNNPKHKFMLSTRTLKKIREWDQCQSA